MFISYDFISYDWDEITILHIYASLYIYNNVICNIEKLKEKNLRRVDLSRFKSEPEVVDGLKKVYEQECYSGIFKDA